jgi:hypothetical protein
MFYNKDKCGVQSVQPRILRAEGTAGNVEQFFLFPAINAGSLIH